MEIKEIWDTLCVPMLLTTAGALIEFVVSALNKRAESKLETQKTGRIARILKEEGEIQDLRHLREALVEECKRSHNERMCASLKKSIERIDSELLVAQNYKKDTPKGKPPKGKSKLKASG